MSWLPHRLFALSLCKTANLCADFFFFNYWGAPLGGPRLGHRPPNLCANLLVAMVPQCAERERDNAGLLLCEVIISLHLQPLYGKNRFQVYRLRIYFLIWFQSFRLRKSERYQNNSLFSAVQRWGLSQRELLGVENRNESLCTEKEIAK